jgi:hypothetical protein
MQEVFNISVNGLARVMNAVSGNSNTTLIAKRAGLCPTSISFPLTLYHLRKTVWGSQPRLLILFVSMQNYNNRNEDISLRPEYPLILTASALLELH